MAERRGLLCRHSLALFHAAVGKLLTGPADILQPAMLISDYGGAILRAQCSAFNGQRTWEYVQYTYKVPPSHPPFPFPSSTELQAILGELSAAEIRAKSWVHCCGLHILKVRPAGCPHPHITNESLSCPYSRWSPCPVAGRWRSDAATRSTGR